MTNESKTRLSYATFFIPLDEVEIEPLSHFINSQESPPLYKKVKYGDYVRQTIYVNLLTKTCKTEKKYT